MSPGESTSASVVVYSTQYAFCHLLYFSKLDGAAISVHCIMFSAGGAGHLAWKNRQWNFSDCLFESVRVL